MKKAAIMLAAWVITMSALATNYGRLTGVVSDKRMGTPIGDVSITISKLQDSTVLYSTLSDTSGFYEFGRIPEGDYFVSAYMMGYKDYTSEPVELDPNKGEVHSEIKMENLELKEVKVVGKKPYIEQKADKTVLNIESSSTATSENALEILRKAPGIMIDKDENVSLRGKEGVLVLVDDRPTYLSSTELANFLKNMQGSEVESIEIITNPSARYEASGNSGIINIRTKKNRKPGFNGTVSGGSIQGRKNASWGGLNLNGRKGKVNVYANYYPGLYQGDHTQNIYRKIQNPQNTLFDQVTEGEYKWQSHSYKAGIDVDINKKNTVGFMYRGYANKGDNTHDGATKMYNYNRTEPDSILSSLSENSGRNRNNAFNLNYMARLDSSGNQLSADVDYATFRNTNDQRLTSNYLDALNNPLHPATLLRGNMPNNVDIKSAKVDYVHPFATTWKLETGAKTSFVTTDNKVTYENQIDNVWQPDLGKSNHFRYDENIYAAYASVSKELKSTSVQVGLRSEYTDSKGNSLTMDSVVSRSYLDFFPTVFINHKFNDNHNLSFSYNRRIDRPNYESLNPFLYFLDEYTFGKGNPYLKPQYTNSVTATHSFKSMFITSLGYSRTNDAAVELIEQDDSTKYTYQTTRNLNTMNNVNLNVSVNLNPAPWFRSNSNVNAFYNRYEYEQMNVSKEQVSVRVQSTNTFELPKNFSIEVTGFYQSPMLWGLMNIKSMYSVDFGVQKYFWNKKANIKLTLRDPFKLMKFKADMNYANLDGYINNTWDSRRIGLSFSYRFGNDDIKPSRQRKSGLEDEQNRVGGGSQGQGQGF